MSERANGLDAVAEPQRAAVPEQAQSIEEDTEQAASRLDGARQQPVESPARPRTQAQVPQQPAHSATPQQTSAADFMQTGGMYPNQRAAQRRHQAAMQATAAPQQPAEQRFTSASVAVAMQGLLNYQNDSGEDIGGVFTNPDEISPEGLGEYASGSGFVG